MGGLAATDRHLFVGDRDAANRADVFRCLDAATGEERWIVRGGYGLGYIQDSIWKAVPWSNSLRGLLDAAIYAVVTGLVFRLLWPAA